VRARRCGTVAAGTACLRVQGSGAAVAPAAPESPSSLAAHPRLQATNLTPPHELPQRVAILRGMGQGRNGPARRGASLIFSIGDFGNLVAAPRGCCVFAVAAWAIGVAARAAAWRRPWPRMLLAR
jgi:hypothetical protein